VTEEASKHTPLELQKLSPTFAENWKLQALMDSAWWAENYDDALASYTDTISG
jgi:hypothetical protein